MIVVKIVHKQQRLANLSAELAYMNQSSIQHSVFIISESMEWLNVFTEPIGGTAPKFSQETKSLSFIKPTQSVVSLMCAAQGFPVPAFRLGYFLIFSWH